MREPVSELLAERAKSPAGLSRLVGYSFAVHATLIAIIAIVPAEWLRAKSTQPDVMVISLAGSPGVASTGLTPIGDRRVDEAVPDPKRPEPVKPVMPTKPDVMPTPAKPAESRTPPKPVEKPTVAPPPPSTAKPTVTGKQVQPESAPVETGSKSDSQGLKLGGGEGTGGDVDLNTFYPEWSKKLVAAVELRWDSLQREVGFVIVRFTMNRDGSVTDLPEQLESSGSFELLQVSRRAIMTAKLPPLPAEYTGKTLTIRFDFRYVKGKQP